jgi:hypothetical protein
MADTPSASSGDNKTREFLSITLVVLALSGIVLLSAVTLLIGRNIETAKWVFGAVMPVLGTWVGTVLAFYFSKENFNAAAQSVADMARQASGIDKLRTMAVRDKMIPASQIKSQAMTPADAAAAKLSDLLTTFAGYERILLLNSGGGAVLYLIYRAEINAYLGEVALSTAPGKPDPATVTVQNLIDSSPRRKTLFTSSFDVVAVTATLADAKIKMDKIDHCNDIFVTNNGGKEEPLLGWITDNTLIENARV